MTDDVRLPAAPGSREPSQQAVLAADAASIPSAGGTADGLTAEELTEAFEYLDELRNSGRTNMYGASQYIYADLCWPLYESQLALKWWMRTFSGASVASRVASAIEAASAGETRSGSTEGESATRNAGDAR